MNHKVFHLFVFVMLNYPRIGGVFFLTYRHSCATQYVVPLATGPLLADAGSSHQCLLPVV